MKLLLFYFMGWRLLEVQQVLKKGRKQLEKLMLNVGFGYIPQPKQATAHSAKERYILFGGAIRGGKSYFLCAEGLQLSLDFPGNIGYICRYERSVFMTTTYNIMMRIIPEKIIKNHNKQLGRIDLVNGSIINYGGLKSTGTEDALTRLKSMDLGWFAWDEASDGTEDLFLFLCGRLNWIPPEVKKVDNELVYDYVNIDGKVMRRKFRYKGLLASNPEPGWVKTRFVDQYLEDHKFIPALPTDNKYLPPNYIENLRKLYPAEWVKKYLDGSWDIDDSTLRVFPYRLVKQAVENEIEPEKDARREWGVDVARFGDDKNIVAERVGGKVRIIYESMKEDTMTFVSNIDQMILNRKVEERPDLIRIDTVGLGSGVFDRLKEKQEAGDFKYKVKKMGEKEVEKDIGIYEFVGGWASGSPDKYNNFRTEVHWRFRREYLEEGLADLPDDLEMSAEFTNIRYKLVSDRRIQVESKDEMKKRGIKSPNKLDAILMSFYGKDLEVGEPKLIWIDIPY